jgi:translocation and assembly module TamB
MPPSEATDRKRPFYGRAAVWFVRFCLVLASGLMLVFALIQTGPGKELLGAWASKAVEARTGMQLRIEGLDGFIPFEVTAGRAVLGPEEDPWLCVRAFSFQWFPRALLSGRLHVGRLEASGVDLLRLPPEHARVPEPASEKPDGPISLPPVLLERFAVDRLSVHASVMGEEAEFTASGRMAVSEGGEEVKGNFRLQRLGVPEERAGLRWVLKTSPIHLDLDLELLEPDRGLLSGLAGLRPEGLRLVVSGKGPPGAWQGNAAVETGAWGSMLCSLEADAAEDQIILSAGGDFKIDRDLLQDAADFAPGLDAGEFSLAGSFSRAGVVSIKRLSLTAAGMETEASGVFDAAGGSVEGRLELTASDLSRYRVPGFPVSSGLLTARLLVEGRLDEPLARLHARVSGLRAQDVEIGSLDAAFSFHPEPGVGPPFLEGLKVEGRGSLKDAVFRSKGAVLQRESVDWELDTRLVSRDALSVSRLLVRDGNLHADYSGMIRLQDLSLEGSAGLRVEDLAKAPFLESSGIGGGLSLEAMVRADGVKGDAAVDVKGLLDRIGPVPAELEPLVKAGGEFRGSAAVRGGRTVSLLDFRMAFPGLEVKVEGDADLMSGAVDLSLLAVVPDVNVLSSAAGRPLEGRAELKALVSGDLRDPGADLELTVRECRVDEMWVGDFRASFHTRRILPAPGGRVELEVLRGDLNLLAGAVVELEEPFLRFNDMSVRGPGAVVTGDVSIHMPSGRVAGDLHGSVQSLSPAGSLLGREVDGKGSFLVNLFQEDERQNVLLDVRLDGFSSLAGAAHRVELKGIARDVLGEVSGEAAVEVTGFRHGEILVERLAINAAGVMGSVTAEVDLSGALKEPFRVASRGELAWSGDQTEFNLETLALRFGSHGLALAAPAGVRLLPDNGLEAGPMVFDLDSGTLEVRGRVTEQIHFEADLRELPLSLLTLAGGPPVEGQAGGAIRLSGTALDPAIEVELTAEDIGLPDPALGHIPRFGLSSSVSLGGGRMEASLSLAQGGNRPVEAFVALPARVTLSPFSMDFPGRGEIKGGLSADMDLEPLPLWLSMAGVRLSGELRANFSLAGSLEAPAVTGEARVENGVLEVLRSGSVFRELDILAKVNGEDLTLERARAVDGRGGTMEAEGRLRAVPGEGFPFQGSLEMSSFHMIRRDEIRAVTGAEIEVSGMAREALLKGVVKVSSAEVKIPDRLPPKIHSLEVVEQEETAAGARPEAEEPADAGNGTGGAFRLDLDLDVEIPGRTFVRGRGLDSEWKGALRVDGNASAPEVSGELGIVRGHFDFFGERFSLASGSVFLDGSYPPDPVMDVTAERRKAGMTGRVTLSGRPSTLGVSVSSDPPMPEDEVMARLLFGRSLTTVTPIQALKLARAMDAMAGGGTFEFIDEAQRALGVDRVELIQSDDPGGSAALSVGKYVGDDAYVAVEKGLGDDGGKVSVEYEITPRISVQTEVGADSAGGVEVRWKWDY